jgi:hypothetical protein
MGAWQIFENNWRAQAIGLRLASWLSYNLARFMKALYNDIRY